jgi:hypothetical protein
MYVGHMLYCLEYISVHASELITPFLIAAIHSEYILIIGFSLWRESRCMQSLVPSVLIGSKVTDGFNAKGDIWCNILDS